MKRFKLSPEAAVDIRSIWAFIAQDNVKAARRVRLKIFAACQQVAETPGIGHRRKDLTDKPVLFCPVDHYLIIFSAARKPIEVVRVLHGALDIPTILMTT
jgi:plasmid stabilization system protein ParE